MFTKTIIIRAQSLNSYQNIEHRTCCQIKLYSAFTYSISAHTYMTTQPKFPLPPGHDSEELGAEINARDFVVQRSKELGPIFAARHHGHLKVYIVDIALGREFLREHSASVRSRSLNLEALFPNGFLRTQTGETHQKYRRILTQAITPSILIANKNTLVSTVCRELDKYSSQLFDDDQRINEFLATLNLVATEMLLQLFFGVDVRHKNYSTLIGLFHKLGPNGLVWDINETQQKIFQDIHDLLRSQINESSHCIMGNVLTQNALDDTLLGNLIYMVEMGRFDLYSLFRWIAKYASENGSALDAISLKAHQNNSDTCDLADAFVKETLRMDQSEKLDRLVVEEVVFRGFRIPKETRLEVRLWESHKSHESFDDPFNFNPTRFIHSKIDQDQYSPFGLDQHHCPFSNITLTLSNIFLTTLAKNYHVKGINNGPPTIGLYHWQPAWNFSLQLQDRL